MTAWAVRTLRFDLDDGLAANEAEVLLVAAARLWEAGFGEWNARLARGEGGR
jgi:hypothetical protein